jgi:hypothetical protein
MSVRRSRGRSIASQFLANKTLLLVGEKLTAALLASGGCAAPTIGRWQDIG